MKSKLFFGCFFSAAFVCILIATGISAPDVMAIKDDPAAPGVGKLVGDTINGLIITNSGGDGTIGGLDVLAPASGRDSLTVQGAGAGRATIQQTSGMDRIFDARPVNLAEQYRGDSRPLTNLATRGFPL